MIHAYYDVDRFTYWFNSFIFYFLRNSLIFFHSGIPVYTLTVYNGSLFFMFLLLKFGADSVFHRLRGGLW